MKGNKMRFVKATFCNFNGTVRCPFEAEGTYCGVCSHSVTVPVWDEVSDIIKYKEMVQE